MKGLMDLLARAKLVELSEDEKQSAAESALDRGAGDEVVAPPPVAPPPPVSAQAFASPQTAPATGVDPTAGEGKSFEAIYAAAGIPASPYPAEKLLRLLDGLRTMDSATRKTAVLAMDAADDTWQVADCVTDAQNKIAAITGYKQYLSVQLGEGEQLAATRVSEIGADLDAATAAIRSQIAELEQLLQRKITQSAQDTAGIEADLRSTREAVARESRRMDVESDRLREISAQFTTTSPGAN
jgi:hypothetical protein